MKMLRMVSGITLLTASAWLGPALSKVFGVSEVFGYVGFASIVAFLGGMLFYSGIPVVRRFRWNCRSFPEWRASPGLSWASWSRTSIIRKDWRNP